MVRFVPKSIVVVEPSGVVYLSAKPQSVGTPVVYLLPVAVGAQYLLISTFFDRPFSTKSTTFE